MTSPLVVWAPQEGPQTALLECPVFEVFFGGARGGGKTDGSLGDWLQHQALYGEYAVGKFFRRKQKQLSDTIARSKQIFRHVGAKYNENKFEWTFPGGARLGFAYLERDSDAEEYQGHSYSRVYLEEVTNFPSATPINKLRGAVRSAHGVPCGMRLTGNPGGPGHNWVKARYITPNKHGYETITQSEELELDGVKQLVSISRVFIPSKLMDNQILFRSDPAYVLRLRQTGSEALVKAWLEGNWDIVDGSYFNEFEEGKHVLETQAWLPRIPADALRFRAFDWGSAKPFCCGWYAVSNGLWGLPAGALVKYREWYGAKGDNVGLKMQVPEVAKGILVREATERIRFGRADPSIFIQNGGPSIGEQMAVNRCIWWRGDNRRQPGWEQLRARLQGIDGVPMLYFLDCCEDTIRTLPTLQHDANNAEDLDTDGEDHAADETRYAVMSRPILSLKHPDFSPPNPSGMPTFREMMERNAKRTQENPFGQRT